MLNQIDMLTDIAEYETMTELSNYLIKECEMILYNDNLIMEAESETDTTVKMDTPKPTALQKIGNVLKKIWNTIKAWFAKLKVKAQKFPSKNLKEKANEVSADLSAKLKVLGNRKLPNETEDATDENVAESYYFTEAKNNNNNGNNNNNNNQQQNQQQQQQNQQQQPPPPDPILMFKASNNLSKQQAEAALYAIRFKSGRYKTHVDLKGFKKLCGHIESSFGGFVDYLDNIVKSQQYKMSETGKYANQMKKAVTAIKAESEKIISTEDITDKKGNKSGQFSDGMFGIKLEDFGKYYSDTIDAIEKYTLEFLKYQSKLADPQQLINVYINHSKKVQNAVDDKRVNKILDQNVQNLTSLVEASKLALEFINGFGLLTNKVKLAIDYDLKLITSVNTYTDGFISFFKKLGYVKNQTKAAINTVKLA